MDHYIDLAWVVPSVHVDLKLRTEQICGGCRIYRMDISRVLLLCSIQRVHDPLR